MAKHTLKENATLKDVTTFLEGFEGAPIKFEGEDTQFIRSIGGTGQFNFLENIADETQLKSLESSKLVTQGFVELPLYLKESLFEIGGVYGATTPLPTTPPPEPKQISPTAKPLGEGGPITIPTGTPLSNPSIVDYLNSVGQDSSFSNRAQLAKEQGIVNYTGTADQNTQLLSLLREGTTKVQEPEKSVVQTSNLTKVATGSTGPDGPIYNVFEGDKHISDPNDPRLVNVNISLLKDREGGVPVGFQSKFDAVGGEQNVQAEIDAINEEENQGQQEELDTMEEEFGENVDLSTSTKITEKLTELLEGAVGEADEAPAPPSLIDQFNTLQATLGITSLQAELAGIETEIQQLEADFASTIEGEEARKVSMFQIRRRQSAQEIAFNRAKRDLIVERDSISKMVSNKVNTLGIMMDLTQQDFENASQQYTEQFNRNMDMIDLLRGEEDRIEESADRQTKRVQDAKDQALSNWEVQAGVYESNGLTWDTLSPQQQIEIESLAVQAGFPGLSQFIGAGSGEIRNVTSRTDANGNAFYDLLRVKPDGSVSLESYYRGVGGGVRSDPSDPTTTDENGNDDGSMNIDDASDTTLNVIEGIESISDQTPSKQTLTRTELRKLGFYKSTPPQWYIDKIGVVPEGFIGPLEEGQTREDINELWEKERQSVIKEKEESSGSDRTP